MKNTQVNDSFYYTFIKIAVVAIALFNLTACKDEELKMDNPTGAAASSSIVTVTISSKPSSATTTAAASFSFSGIGIDGATIASYQCSVDSTTLAPCVSPKAFTGLTDGNHTFRIKAIDTNGKESLVSTYSWSIDTVAPVASISSNPSSLNNLSTVDFGFSATDTGGSGVSSFQCAFDAGAYASCSSPTQYLAVMTGAHTFSLKAIDAAGNASTVQTYSWNTDLIPPSITISNATNVKGGVTNASVSWTLTETTIAASTNFTVDFYNGTSWSTLGTVAATAGSNSSANYSYTNITVPSVNVATAKYRVTISDSAGNQTIQLGSTFNIDISAPVLSATRINDDATYAGTAVLNVKTTVSDNYSTSGNFIKIASAHSGTGDCQSEYADSGWQSWTSSTQNFAFSVSPVDGTKKLCLWAKDSVGNISVQSPTTGTAGVNTDSIQFQLGNPPKITGIFAMNTNNSTQDYALGDPVTINWSATDTEGLDVNPIAIGYSTDGIVFNDITSNADFSVESNRTWRGAIGGNLTSASGSVTTFTAPSAGIFFIKIVARDLAGNSSISAQAQPQNTPNWKVFAGTTDRGDGGSGPSAALFSQAAGGGQIFAVDPTTNDIYAMDELFGIRKLNIQTGKVSTFLAHGNLNLAASGTLSASSRILALSYSRMKIDSNGIMWLLLGSMPSSLYTSKIYKINLATGAYSFYFGGGANETTAATAATAYVSGGAFDFDDSNNLYYVTDCTPGAPTFSTYKKVMMVAQNPDGTAGAITHVLGNCAAGTPSNGQTATAAPFMTGALNYTAHLSIAAINSNFIYISAYNQNPIKIINGVVNTTAVGANSRAGILSYHRPTNRICRANSLKGISYFTPVSTGAGGESLTTVAVTTGTGSCMEDGTSASSSCVVVDMGFSFDSNGQVYFADGLISNSATGYRIRYIDPTNTIRTAFGALAFSGHGQDRGLIRGKIGGIYYKKSTEPNQTSFPAGLYLVSPAMIFGRINESNSIYETLYGNQQGDAVVTSDNSVITPSLSMGYGSTTGHGMAFTMGTDGLPWIKKSSRIVKIDDQNRLQNRMTAASVHWEKVADGGVANTSAASYAGVNNLVVKGDNSLIFAGGYGDAAAPLDTIPQVRILDFDTNVSTMLMGGAFTYLTDTARGFSADQTTPGTAKAAAFQSVCATNYNACAIQYVPSEDRLYMKAGSGDRKLRYLTTPTNTTTSTLITMPLQFNASITPLNFIFKEDLTRIYYISSAGLYCMKPDGTTPANCDNSTNLYPYSATMGTFTYGPNQMTWKDANTLLISDYNGKVLQYTIAP